MQAEQQVTGSYLFLCFLDSKTSFPRHFTVLKLERALTGFAVVICFPLRSLLTVQEAVFCGQERGTSIFEVTWQAELVILGLIFIVSPKGKKDGEKHHLPLGWQR